MGDIFSQEHAEPDTVDRGVTLVELLTVIAIISMAVGIPLVTMLSQRHSATLDEGHATVLQALNTTRSRAVAGVGEASSTGHIACVRENGVEIFTWEECSDCSKDCPGGDMRLLPPGIQATTTATGIEFARLSGTSEEADIVVTGFGNTATVTVSEYGFIQ